MKTLERPTDHAAFTLLEVLLAVAIFGIVLAAINAVFYSALRLRNRTAQAVEKALPIQQTLKILKRDLEGIVPPGGTLSGTLKSGVSTSTMDPQANTEIYTGTGTLSDDVPWANVQKVAYSLRDPARPTLAGGKDLYRLVSRNLLPTTQEQVEEQWLMDSVQQLQFFFYDGSSWRNTWDSTTEPTILPKAIKVQINLVDATTVQRLNTPIEVVVPITIYADTNQTQQTQQNQQ